MAVMCYWMNVDGHAVHVNTGRKPKYCDCGHVAPFLCDWKMPAKESGTCDNPIVQSTRNRLAKTNIFACSTRAPGQTGNAGILIVFRWWQSNRNS